MALRVGHLSGHDHRLVAIRLGEVPSCNKLVLTVGSWMPGPKP